MKAALDDVRLPWWGTSSTADAGPACASAASAERSMSPVRSIAPPRVRTRSTQLSSFRRGACRRTWG
jgi:hypothetical protein